MSGGSARLGVEIFAALGSFREDLGKAFAIADANAKKIQGAFAGAEAQIAGFSKKLLGIVGVPLGISAIIGALGSIRDKTIDDEKSLNQLAATLAATGHAAGLTAGQLATLSSKVAANSPFDETEIRKAEVALLRFRNIQGDVFRDALSTSAVLARALGTTVPDAATMLGKALSGQGTAGMKGLKDAGVFLSEQLIDTAARMDETGDRAGSMRLKLDEVRKSLGSGGSSQSLGGDINKVSRAWDDLQKTFGHEVFGNTSRTAQYLTTSFEGLTVAIGNAGAAYDKLGELMTVEGLFKYVAGAAFGIKFKPPRPTQEQQDQSAEEDSAKFMGRAKAKAGAAQQLQDQADDAAYIALKLHITKMAEGAQTAGAKKLLEDHARIDSEQSSLAEGYARGEVTIEDFYATQQRLSKASTVAVIQDIRNRQEAEDAIINAKMPGKNLPLYDPAQVADAKKREADLANQATGAIIQFYKQEQQSAAAARVDVEKLGDQYSVLAEKIATAMGNTAAATALSTARENRQFRSQLVARGDTGAVTALDSERTGKVRQAELADETRKYTNTVEDLGIAQARVDLQAQTGALSEIDLLNKKAEIAKQYIPILMAQIAAQQMIVDAMGPGVEKDAAVRKLNAEKLAVEQLSVAASALKNKFDAIFTDNLTLALDAVVNRTKSVKQAFKDMATSIGQEITHLANQQIAKMLWSALFGSGGPTGGTSPGGLLAMLFGGGGSSTSDPGHSAGGGGSAPGALLGGTNLGGLFGLLAAKAGVSSTAISSWFSSTPSPYIEGSSSFVGPLGGPTNYYAGVQGGEFGYAEGTNFAPGGWAMVGERGPELVNLPRGSQVVPNHALNRGGGRSITIHLTQTVMPGASRASADQSGRAAAREISMAIQRA